MTVVGRLGGVVMAAVGRQGVVVMTVVGRPSVGSPFRTDTRAELLNLCRQSITELVAPVKKVAARGEKTDMDFGGRTPGAGRCLRAGDKGRVTPKHFTEQWSSLNNEVVEGRARTE